MSRVAELHKRAMELANLAMVETLKGQAALPSGSTTRRSDMSARPRSTLAATNWVNRRFLCSTEARRRSLWMRERFEKRNVLWPRHWRMTHRSTSLKNSGISWNKSIFGGTCRSGASNSIPVSFSSR